MRDTLTSTHCPRRTWDALTARQMLGVLTGYEAEYTRTPWARRSVRLTTSRMVGWAIILAGCRRSEPHVPYRVVNELPILQTMPIGEGSAIFQHGLLMHVHTPPNRPIPWKEFLAMQLPTTAPVLRLHAQEVGPNADVGLQFAFLRLAGELGVFTNVIGYADSSELLHADPNVRRQMLEELRPLMRDVIGYPFREPIATEWLTSDVVMIAQNAWSNQAWDSLPILADAMQDAGCDHEEALNYLRGGGPHFCGCWVLTEILAPHFD